MHCARTRVGGFSLFGFIFVFISIRSNAQDLRPYVQLDAVGNSEPISILNAIHGWKGADALGRRQYATLWAELGATNGAWGLGILQRKDYSLKFTQDTAELYGSIVDDHSIPVGKTYALKVDAHILEAKGIRAFARRELVPGLDAEVGISWLSAFYMMEGSVQGTGVVTAPKSYDYALAVDYAYTKDCLFGREVSPPKGVGTALDFSIDWRFLSGWQFKGRLVDVSGSITWKNLPYTQANANSHRTHTDEQDFQHWDPLISGTELTHSRFRQSLPTRGSGELYHHGSDWDWAIGATSAFGDCCPRLGCGKKLGEWHVFTWCWPRERALGLDVRRGRWGLGLTMDKLDVERAHALQLQFSYRP